MSMDIAIAVECAKGEIMNALQQIQQQHALPPCIIDGILSSILAEVRSEAKLDLMNAANTIIQETNEEFNKAKTAAKKVLKAETEQEEAKRDDGTGETDETN